MGLPSRAYTPSPLERPVIDALGGCFDELL
jgi:hypothetical protein